MNTWVSFQSAEQPLLGQFSVSGNIREHQAGSADPFAGGLGLVFSRSGTISHEFKVSPTTWWPSHVAEQYTAIVARRTVVVYSASFDRRLPAIATD
ncbi:hypothetical protein [Pseudomonas shahriarae]|uniref:hypothetical protein n=1 Tax=Pseudomonas shahriarae TaxID=2745512 RepID=UPI003A10169A